MGDNLWMRESDGTEWLVRDIESPTLNKKLRANKDGVVHVMHGARWKTDVRHDLYLGDEAQQQIAALIADAKAGPGDRPLAADTGAMCGNRFSGTTPPCSKAAGHDGAHESGTVEERHRWPVGMDTGDGLESRVPSPTPSLPAPQEEPRRAMTIRYPFPLRPNCVAILTLPNDLTPEEVERLGRFLRGIAEEVPHAG